MSFQVNECTGPNRPCSVGAECHNKIVHVDGLPFECICPDGTNGTVDDWITFLVPVFFNTITKHAFNNR